MVWRLLAAKEPRLSAAAPFYGPFPEGGNLKGNKAAVLGVYGGLDARVNATREAARAGAARGQAAPPDPHVHRGRPRVLQRHRRALQRPGRGGGVAAGGRLVRRLSLGPGSPTKKARQFRGPLALPVGPTEEEH